MRHIILITLAVLAVAFAGCANVRLKTVDENGNPVEAEYTRWWNQELEGLSLESPSGWKVKLERQKSELELAFGFGAASVKVGGDDE
ncbi:hypothetical protein DRH27_01290 [Candidatus Falkowbacteria bacterium]|nr:MAG: hypothetical protein DRH27_01290 [Candidatus Falkowbacteria bacterium]